MLIGYKLSPQSRAKLLEAFPPQYAKVRCDHITYKFGVPKDAELPEQPKVVEVVGYIVDETGLEGFLVSIDGNTVRPDGSKYHITLSLDQDRKSVETNDFVDEAVAIDAIPINVIVYSE